MPLQIALLAGLATVAGPVLFVRAFRDFRLRRLIQNTPTSRLRSMSMGLVEVTGAVEPRSAATAPFSGRPCVYWEVDISTRSRRNQWTVVHRNASGSPFFLRDETGVALVYPHGATCKLNYGVEEECLGIALPDCYAQYLHDQRLKAAVLWRMGQMRFRERVIAEGEAVFVLGTATPKAHAIAISDGDQLQATGTDDAGAHRLRQLDQECVGVIRRGESETTFILSEESEKQIAFDVGLRGWGEMIGGPLLTLLGLGYWLSVLSARMGR
jgi:hypothetical protein